MASYMQESHGDWLAAPFESDLAGKLDEKFEVDGIPTLVVLKADGTLVSKDGTSAIHMKGQETLKDWL